MVAHLVGAGSIPVPSTLILRMITITSQYRKRFWEVDMILIKKFTQRIAGYINTKYYVESGNIS